MTCTFDVSSVLSTDITIELPCVRVRPLTERMRYTSLLKRNVIPDLETLMVKIKKPKYPKFVISSKKYALYGMFIDIVLRKYMSGYFEVSWGDDDPGIIRSVDINEYSLIANRVAAKMLNETPFYESNIIEIIPDLREMCQNIVNQWLPQYGNKLQYNVELKCGKVAGHPDILSDNVLWDIKCGHTQKPTRLSAYLQLLSYWAMSSYSVIGFILPLSGQIHIFDMRNFNKTFMRYELMTAGNYATIHSVPQARLDQRYPIGSHVSNKGIVKSINDWVQICYDYYDEVRPMQMYLESSRCEGQCSTTVDDIPLASSIIEQYGLQFFTHAPLSMNIASGSSYPVSIINRALQQTQSLGGMGVIVHTGQYMKLSEEQAYQNQATLIRTVLQSATSKCRLLLETPCGEGTEICETLFKLNTFLQTNFSDSELLKIGLCVDTCHVYASGASPFEYIEYWVENGCVGIGLIHFNDSKDFYGNCKDNHQQPGYGNIGYDEMERIAKFCTERGIPMVHE